MEHLIDVNLEPTPQPGDHRYLYLTVLYLDPSRVESASIDDAFRILEFSEIYTLSQSWD